MITETLPASWQRGLPRGWRWAKLNHVAHLGTGHTPDRARPEYWVDCTVPWVTASDLSQRASAFAPLMETEQQISELGLANSAAVLHPAQTVMFCRTASVGLFCITGTAMATTQAFVTWTAGPALLPRYLLYVIAGMRAEFDRLAYGSTHLTIYMPDLEALRIPLPPLDEQRRIADFLDDQTTRIDQIIAGRRGQSARVLEHQSETRRVAIRGLDEAADEPSEIGGWLGRISSEFAVRRIGALSRVYAGAGFPPEHQGRGKGDLPFMKVSDLANSDSIGRVVSAANYVDGALAATLGAKPAPAGTIVFPKVGAALLTNRRAVLGVQAVFDNNVMGLDFLAADRPYMLHVLRDLDLGQFSNPGPVPSVNESTVKDILVPLPTTQKQRQIADHLDQVAHDARATVAILGESITLLQQFKRSLISAAVSGEIDVSAASGRRVPA